MRIVSKGQGTLIKILSLATGLTIGLVLIARVQLERNFDRCISHKEDVYEIHETFQRQGEGSMDFNNTPGGIIPKMCEYIPEIISGTRYTEMFSNENITLEDKRKVMIQSAIFADSCLFDIFTTKIVQGKARNILSISGQCLISRRLYEKIGSDVIGKTFTFASAPGKPITISGVFENYDENSSHGETDIIMSLPSIGIFSYDGTTNLLGNDRYHSFVRLRHNADMVKIRKETDRMLKEILPWDQIHKAGYTDAGVRFVSVMGTRMQDDTVRTTCTILSIVAMVLLFTAVMNYILVVLSTLVGHARQISIRRCMGAPSREFYLSTLRESAIHLILALTVMGIILIVGQEQIRELLGVSVSTLFSSQTFLVLLSVCFVVLVICGLLPGYVYAHIPLAYVCRQYSESKRTWKLSLLGFQFVLCAMLLTVLVTIYNQYNYMLNKDMGYEYKDVAYITSVMSSDSVYTFEREMEKLPFVRSASGVYSLYCANQSGDNVTLPGEDRELFNICELYFQESNIIETMGLTLVQGKGFTPLGKSGVKPEVLVDERFAEKMKTLAGWDNIVGRQIINKGVGKDKPLTIVGVVRNIVIGSLTCRDERPMMIINGNYYCNHIVVKLQSVTPENLSALQRFCDKMYPDQELVVKTYSGELADSYVTTLRTRNLIAIGCMATLLITLIGLIGYVRDEVARRSKELAIRRVLGAMVIELQGLFIRSVAVIALPTIVIGCMLGYYICTLMMQLFPDNIGFNPWNFALVVPFVSFIFFAVIFFQTYRSAQKNPVEGIKTE